MLDMLSATLQRLIDDHHTTPAKLADASGYAGSTVYDWIAGKSRIPADAVASWMRAESLGVPTREAILHAITGGRACLVRTPTDAELDADGDGEVTEQDELMSLSMVAQHLARELKEVVEANSDGRRDPRENQRINAIACDMRRIADRIAAIDQRLLERDTQRKPARPLRMAEGGAA